MQKFKRSSMKETRNILNSCKIRVCEKVQAFLHEGNQKHSEFLAPRYWRSILLAQNIVNPFLFSAEQLSYLNVLLYWQSSHSWQLQSLICCMPKNQPKKPYLNIDSKSILKSIIWACWIPLLKISFVLGPWWTHAQPPFSKRIKTQLCKQLVVSVMTVTRPNVPSQFGN